MASNTIHFAPGILIAFGQMIDAKPHQHNLWQLCFPFGDCWLNQQHVTGAVIIKPNEPHQLKMPKGWVVLVEPESTLAQVIQQNSICLPTEIDATDVATLIEQLVSFPLLVSTLTSNPYQSKDTRILQLLHRLDTCLLGDCIKPEQWRAKDVAQWLSLSQSRFLHLIKEQLGMSWRAYLKWRRLGCALMAIKSGRSLTDAAYISGFSDASHLCRMIKQTFGMTSKQLLKSFSNALAPA